MTPRRLDLDILQQRLRMITESVEQLRGLDGVTGTTLRGEPLRRAATERLLQVIVDLAVDINAHIIVAYTGAAPETARTSFTKLASVGAIDDDLAENLAPSAGLRNILVHNYLDIDVDIVAGAVTTTLRDYPMYVRSVARFITAVG